MVGHSSRYWVTVKVYEDEGDIMVDEIFSVGRGSTLTEATVDCLQKAKEYFAK